MAKAKRDSKQSSSTPTKMVANGKMVLRIRTRSTKQAVEVIKQQTIKPRSAKKPKTNKAAKLDTNKPKKPPTAFFYFLEDFRKGFQEQNPDVKSMRDVGKACGEKWKTMNYEEKVQYYDIATEKRAEFDRAMADYTKRMESGEEQELEQDSEFDE